MSLLVSSPPKTYRKEDDFFTAAAAAAAEEEEEEATAGSKTAWCELRGGGDDLAGVTIRVQRPRSLISGPSKEG